MRRHVERMRRCRGDFCVGPRSGQRKNRKPWRIIAVDQVMGDAGMVRLLRQDAVQDRRRLFLIRIGFVGWRRSCNQGKRVKNGGFVVFRIARRKPLHSVTPGERALPMGYLIRILIKLFDCGNVVAFTLCFGSNRVGFFDRSHPFPQIGRRGRKPYRVIEAHSDAPVSHRASRIDTDYARKMSFPLRRTRTSGEGRRRVRRPSVPREYRTRENVCARHRADDPRNWQRRVRRRPLGRIKTNREVWKRYLGILCVRTASRIWANRAMQRRRNVGDIASH